MKIKIGKLLINWNGDNQKQFNWDLVPDIDPMQREQYINITDEVMRSYPLAVALQAHEELVQEMMQGGVIDPRRLSEIRGGMKALKRFATLMYGNVNRMKLNIPKPPEE